MNDIYERRQRIDVERNTSSPARRQQPAFRHPDDAIRRSAAEPPPLLVLWHRGSCSRTRAAASSLRARRLEPLNIAGLRPLSAPPVRNRQPHQRREEAKGPAGWSQAGRRVEGGLLTCHVQPCNTRFLAIEGLLNLWAVWYNYRQLSLAAGVRLAPEFGLT